MKVPEKYQKEVKKINRGLYIVWDDKAGWVEPYGRWVIRFKDDRTGLDRKAVVVQDKDGKRSELNLGVLRMIKGSVRWDLVEKFPDPEKIYEELMYEHKLADFNIEMDRKAALMDFVNDNKSMYRDARRNAKKGIFDRPQERERKIIIT